MEKVYKIKTSANKIMKQLELGVRIANPKIILKQADNGWHIILFADAYGEIEDNDKIKIEKKLKKKFNEEIKSISLRFNCKQADSDIKTIIFQEWKAIINELIEKKRIICGFIAGAEKDVEGDTLILKFKDKYVIEILEKENAFEALDKILKKKFGFEVKIKYLLCDNPDKFLELETRRQKELEEHIKEETEKLKEKQKAQAKKSSIFKEFKIKDPCPLNEIYQKTGTVYVIGKIVDVTVINLKNNKYLNKILLTDFTGAITAVKIDKEKLDIKEKEYVGIKGKLKRFNNSLQVNIESINYLPDNLRSRFEREDTAVKKRVELHCHSKISRVDSVCDIKELVETAYKFGHKALAITDHGVVQSFPVFYNECKNKGIKPIYGVEVYMIDNGEVNIYNYDGKQDLSLDEYAVIDMETQGFIPVKDKIVEIGAITVKNNKIKKYHYKAEDFSKTDEFKIKEDEAVHKTRKEIIDFIRKLKKEFKILIFFNFDFINKFFYYDYGINLGNNYCIDVKNIFINLNNCQNKKINLNYVLKCIQLKDKNFRKEFCALEDADNINKIFKYYKDASKSEKLREFDSRTQKEIDIKQRASHIIIYPKNFEGLKEVYELITKSHCEYFYKTPRLPKSLIQRKRINFIISSACEQGEVYRSALLKDKNLLRESMKFYDIIEIQPITNNKFMIENERFESITCEEDLKEINLLIYKEAKKLNKKVIATCDVHFIEKRDKLYRQILQCFQKYTDYENMPDLYFRTTDEMLEEFNYLGKAAAEETVIKNTNFIADEIEEFAPIEKGFYPPEIEITDSEFSELVYRKAEEKYGKKLLSLIKDRLEYELNSIFKNNFTAIYYISYLLVKRAKEDKQFVGSRGSIGSSLVAYMIGITEINPLPAHYRCKNKDYTEFYLEKNIAGIDLESKNCPHCAEELIRDGYNIRFEVFCGFEGEKTPDIDLNFAGEYQPVMHSYLASILGEENVFRAGTVSTLKEKQTAGAVRKYFEEQGLQISDDEITAHAKFLSGVKSTTGQHPGGIVVVPEYKSIFSFTPLQYPAGKKSVFKTTHYEYHSMENNLVKFDILGHDDPAQLKMLYEMTGFDPKKVPLDEKNVLSLFESVKVLNLKSNPLNLKTGVLGIPEFNTPFVRKMVEELKPKNITELVRLSGLSHGTNVYAGNARELIIDKKISLNDIISVRDDILYYLEKNKIDKKKAFEIMERIRKGKGLTEEEEKLLEEKNIPEWYIESCKKISYLFPKAHAAAYVLMAYRIAYYKVYYPDYFYAAHLSLKTEFIDSLVITDYNKAMKIYKNLSLNRNALDAKSKKKLAVIEVIIEAYCRGIEFLPVDLEKSDSYRFTVEKTNQLRCPFITINGLGKTCAKKIEEEREKSLFKTIDDFKKRTKANKNIIELLNSIDFFKEMPETLQRILF